MSNTGGTHVPAAQSKKWNVSNLVEALLAPLANTLPAQPPEVTLAASPRFSLPRSSLHCCCVPGPPQTRTTLPCVRESVF